ncbi:hypothetical protein [Citrobacter sp. BIDMC108]|uniref:hypothetical protein n=1 Tax=Citrobacter sp. BIDMC108 TaxID=1686385 RepID=UPI000657D870|nr:hypothetical protein [Citrobacter sp. BIDMC108]
MKLKELLVQELPKRGGWPEGAEIICSHGNGHVYAYATKCRTSGRQLPIYGGSGQAVTREQYEAALAAAQWNGEGEPPAGTKCEFRVKGESGWESGIVGIVRYTSPFTVVISGDKCEHVHLPTDLEFRPIRSEADKKRYEAVDAMFYALPPDKILGKDIREAIYDAIAAGKIPHVHIE